MKILIAPNSFKECADSVAIASELKKHLLSFIPPERLKNVNLILRPISDGGDGLLNVCKNIFSLQSLFFTIKAPWGNEKIKAEIGYDSYQQIVIIESAKVLGLNLIPQSKRNPLFLSSVGLGQLLLELKKMQESDKIKISRVIIGIGGTGTNDLAVGAMEMLGVKFFNDRRKAFYPLPVDFLKVQEIKNYKLKLPFELELIVDVQNNLLGENGATKVYGPQKGVKEKDFSAFEDGFLNILNKIGIDYPMAFKLNGAGGGLAAGLNVFLGAKIIKAESFIKDVLLNDLKNKEIDLVITGEGKFDEQTLMGKGAGIILNIFSTKPIAFVCGNAAIAGNSRKLKIYRLSRYFNSVDESIKNYRIGLKMAAKEISEDFLLN